MEKKRSLSILLIIVLSFSILLINDSLKNKNSSTSFTSFTIKEITNYVKNLFTPKEKLNIEIPDISYSPDPNGCIPAPVKDKLYVKFKDYDSSTKMGEITISNREIIQPKSADKTFPFKSYSTNKNEREIENKFGLDKWITIQYEEEIDIFKEAEKWYSLSEVEEVDFHYNPCLLLYPSESSLSPFKRQWHHENDGSYGGGTATPGVDIGSIRAWDFTTGEEIIVAAPDTSIFWNHEDLLENIWQNMGEDLNQDGKTIISNGTSLFFYENLDGDLKNRSYTQYIFDTEDISSIDEDGNGYVDDFIGWDFLSNDNNPEPSSTDSFTYRRHGSMVAGLIAGKGNNSLGGSGVCWNCKIIGMRYGVSRPEAIQYAVNNGARVISISWLGSYSGAMRDALDYATEMNVSVFIGIGNYGSETQNNLCTKHYVGCVAGSNHYNTTWDGTSYGNRANFAAPAQDVVSTSHYDHPLNIYVSESGTSLATPIVAGIAALMLSLNPELTPPEIISILQSSTTPLYNPEGKYIGTGQVRADKALELVNDSLNINGHFPVAIINTSGTFSQNPRFYLRGTANGMNFSRYEIWYGYGSYPSEWILWKTAYTPVDDGLLLYDLDLNGMPYGKIHLKLVTIDQYNQSAYATYPYQKAGSCTPGQTAPCGGGICQGIRTCLSDGNWSTCNSNGTEAGDCKVCDVDGEIVFDSTKISGCDDGFSCTTDFCNPYTSSCDHNSNDDNCPEGEFCDTDLFNPPTGCGVIQDCENAPDGTPCDDGRICTDNDQCMAATCQGTPIDCSDGIDCTIDSCNELNGCFNTPNNSSCQNGIWCDGEEYCDSNEGCQQGETPCEAGQICDEENQLCIESEEKQTIILTPGWNLISFKIGIENVKSEDLDSLLVMKYSSGTWTMDLNGQNSFELIPLEGYYVYSNENKQIEFSGSSLASNYKFRLNLNQWNLFGVKETISYSDTYPEILDETFGLYEITPGIENPQSIGYFTSLDLSNLYWANLKGPDFSPPKRRM